MKKFKIENLLYLFIVISPLLDASSCLIGYYFPNIPISPTLVIRSIIPLILLGYIFFKNNKYKKLLILSALLYIGYGVIHLLITNSLIYGISYGGIKEELLYLISYTYNIYLLFIVYYLYNEGKLKYSNRYLFIMLIEYLVIIYFSIFTKTSFTTYLEGMGYRSYFLSGNSISTILILLFSSLISRLNDEYISKRLEGLVMFILLGIYLIFLVGTRTGLLGFVLVLFAYIIANLILSKKIDKKYIIGGVLVLGIIALLVGIFGSETLSRRKHIDSESNKVLDVNTGTYGHTTGDVSTIVWQINNNDIEDGYMSDATRKSYIDLYEYANKNEISANNNRLQQLIFHTSMIKNQHNILYILFGNGRIVHYGEIIMEMELLCILFNFGIVGFILYVMPFIGLIIYAIRKMSIKDVNKSIVMNMFGCFLSLLLSCIAGYVFFSSTCILIMSIMIIKLFKEV